MPIKAKSSSWPLSLVRCLIALILQRVLPPSTYLCCHLTTTFAADAASKAKHGPKSLRPPSLNLPLPGSPATPQFSTTPAPSQDTKAEGQDLVVNGSETSWANEVSTPMVRMFPKGSESGQNAGATPGLSGMGGMANTGMGMPGVPPMLNPFNMAVLNNMGFSNEAQLLAVQMIMNGMVPGQMPAQQGQGHRQGHHNKPSTNNNWRSPASAKYPGSALRTGGFKTSGLKTPGLKTAGLKSAGLGSATTPKEDDIDPELLKDVPAWLKSLRLHKYTHCFEGMTWKEMVELDESTLEAKGVAALGARRRLVKTFDAVKRKMGMAISDPGMYLDYIVNLYLLLFSFLSPIKCRSPEHHVNSPSCHHR
jgi:hypothetical protein